MKTFTFFVFSFLIFISLNSFAQTPKAVEADIYQSFQKIIYWSRYRYEHSRDTARVVNAPDSLGEANKVFGHKLKYYTANFPYTLKLKFDTLNDEALRIYTSADGLFRIYSWDTEMGGTMRDFESVIQYRSGKKTRSVLMADTGFEQHDYINCYRHVYTLKAGSKRYYLATYFGVFSRRNRSEGIQVFSIDKGVLHDALLIKTTMGLCSKLEYAYNLFPVQGGNRKNVLHYNAVSKTIFLPVVADYGKVTNKQIAYKFTERYFERVRK